MKDKHKILNIPILRGIINFVDMMKLSMATLTEAMEMADLFEEATENKKVNSSLFDISI